MKLSEASLLDLVREIQTRVPADLGGHPVSSVSLSLHPRDNDHDWMVHLKLADDRRACGRTWGPVSALTPGNLSGWCLFAPPATPGESGEVLAVGKKAAETLFENVP